MTDFIAHWKEEQQMQTQWASETRKYGGTGFENDAKAAVIAELLEDLKLFTEDPTAWAQRIKEKEAEQDE